LRERSSIGIRHDLVVVAVQHRYRDGVADAGDPLNAEGAGHERVRRLSRPDRHANGQAVPFDKTSPSAAAVAILAGIEAGSEEISVGRLTVAYAVTP
jgi:hypothetical protein